MRRFLAAYVEVAVEMILGAAAVCGVVLAILGLGLLAIEVPYGWVVPAVVVFLAMTVPSAINRADEKRRREEGTQHTRQYG